MMKIYLATISFIDHDNVGEEYIKHLLTNTIKFINPSIIEMKAVELNEEWTDDNPLNKRNTIKDEINKLFGTEFK